MHAQSLKPIAILGAGSWGTALGLYLSRRGQHVQIWSIETAEITAMQADKANTRYLPGHVLPDTLHPMADLATTVKGIKDILVVVPSVGFRQTLTTVKPLLVPGARIICATKGLDAERGKLLSEVIVEVLGKDCPFAILSGPSFAKEVAAGLPAAVALASQTPALLDDLVTRFDSPLFRIHPCDDVIGVEVGGVTKNVIAIATGLFDGLGLGSNARSALITLGLAEIIRLGEALGGKLDTFIGLAGLGDLILTCSDNQSRNRRLGLALGEGKTVAEAERAIGQAIEGKRNAELVVTLAKQHGLPMPICETVWDVVQGKLSAKQGAEQMLART